MQEFLPENARQPEKGAFSGRDMGFSEKGRHEINGNVRGEEEAVGWLGQTSCVGISGSQTESVEGGEGEEGEAIARGV